MSHKRDSNELIGAAPYVFTLLADGRTLSPSPIEQKILVMIGELHRDGLSYRAIAAELNRLAHAIRAYCENTQGYSENLLGETLKSPNG
jgi:hypothetical protein